MGDIIKEEKGITGNKIRHVKTNGGLILGGQEEVHSGWCWQGAWSGRRLGEAWQSPARGGP